MSECYGQAVRMLADSKNKLIFYQRAFCLPVLLEFCCTVSFEHGLMYLEQNHYCTLVHKTLSKTEINKLKELNLGTEL